MNTQCGLCAKQIPKHLRTISCNSCHRFFHVKCCDTNLKEFKGLKERGDDWNCNKCRPPIRNKTKCGKCKKTVCRNRAPIKCVKCKKEYHGTCAGISHAHYTKLCSWNCDKCCDVNFPFSKIDNELLKLTLAAKDTCLGDYMNHTPSFAIQSLLEKFPGSLSCEDISIDTGSSKYYTPSEFIGSKFKKGSFSVLHINIVSLSAHINDLKTLLDVLSHPFHIIGVTETKIRDTQDPLSNISLPGYGIEHTSTTSHFGGAALYIKNGIDYLKRDDLCKSIHNISESIFIELDRAQKKNILVGCIYRHHSSVTDFIDLFLQGTLNKITKEKKDCILMGDYNVDLLKFDSHNETRDYYDLISSHGFRPLILQPTRITSKSATLIDNIFINSMETFSDGGNITTSISDHFPQFCLLDMFDQKEKTTQIKYGRNYKRFNQDEFKNELMGINWEDLFSDKNSDECCNIFYNKITQLLDEMAPIHRLSKKEINLLRLPWITNGLLKSMRNRDRLYGLSSKETDPLKKSKLYNDFKKKRNMIKTLIRKSKRDYYATYFEENRTDIKKTWQGIRDVVNISKKSRVSPLQINYKKEIITSKKGMTNALNNFFVNTGNMVEGKIPKGKNNFTEYLGDSNLRSIFLNPVDNEEITSMVGKLNVSKACGPNSIPSNILKNNLKTLIEPLKHIINISLEQGWFPTLLKMADVCPIYKKSDKSMCENYRPISLLPNISKLFERAMHTRIYEFFESSDIFYDLQFGFRKKYSTNHALLSIVEGIREKLDTKTFSCGVFIDLEKAFDTVNHGILLKKLEHYGIRGVANDWFRSYLSSRKQRVKLDGVFSEWLDVSCGVPQGSILGPLLFLLYINDMHRSVKWSLIHHFADDTNLLCSEKNPDILKKKMNEDLRLIFQWLCANRLSLNVSKTEFIVFKPPRKQLQKRFTLKMNGTMLFESNKIKYLGIIMDDKLTWKHHLYELRKKINRAVGIIYKMKNLCPPRVLLSLYYALIHSHLNYGICVWGNADSHEINKVFLAQKKAVRILSNADYLAPTDPLFSNLGLLKIEDIFKNQIASLMWDHDKGNLPNCFESYFTKVRKIHKYETRMACSNKLSVDMAINTSTHGQTMFKYYGPRIFNEMADLTFYENSRTKNTFRKKYKTHLLGKYK